MKRLWVVVLAVMAGCATVTMQTTCPTSSTGVEFALSGSTVGNTALSMLGGALTKGGLMASAGAAPTTNATMKYTYIPIFGADSGSLTCTEPQPAPGVLVPGPPPVIVH